MYSRSGRRRTLSTTDDILEIHEVVARLSARNKAEDGNDEVEEEEEEEDEEEAALLEEADLEMRKKQERMVTLKREGAGKGVGLKKRAEEGPQKKGHVHEEEELSEPDKKLNESSEIEVYGQVGSVGCLSVWKRVLS